MEIIMFIGFPLLLLAVFTFLIIDWLKGKDKKEVDIILTPLIFKKASNKAGQKRKDVLHLKTRTAEFLSKVLGRK